MIGVATSGSIEADVGLVDGMIIWFVVEDKIYGGKSLDDTAKVNKYMNKFKDSDTWKQTKKVGYATIQLLEI